MAQDGIIQNPNLFNCRNLIVNSAMQFSQRGAVFNFSPTSNPTGGATLDCWRYLQNMPAGAYPTIAVSAQYTAPGVSGLPNNHHWYQRVTVSNQGGASSIPTGLAYSVLNCNVENVYTFEGRTAYLSFYARSTIPNKIFCAEIGQHTGSTFTSCGGKAFTLSNTWKRYSLAVKLPLVAASVTAGHHLHLFFWLMAGTDTGFGVRNGVPGGFTFGGTGDIEISNVQLEADQLTPYEWKAQQEEIMRVHRFLWCPNGVPLGVPGNGYWSTGSYLRYPMAMRAAPSIANLSFNAGTPQVSSVDQFGILLTNSAGNWTAYGQIITVSGQFSAEL